MSTITQIKGFPACSTPFGITEVGTNDAPRGERTHQVLNAFRHHRGRHISSSIRGKPPRVCSTPFGITEVGTDLRRRGWDGQL